jgi:hypothetical protein
MKAKMLLFTCAVMVCAQSVYALTGREIMDKTDALKKPDTAQSKVMMYVYKGNDVAEKEFELTAKRAGGNDTVMISFSKPTTIKLLTNAHKGGDDDQWLRLSSGKVKRIAAGDKDQSFVNSHFYYEDMGSRDINKYEYKLLGDAKAGGADCFKVEAVPKAKEYVYEKAVFYVRKADFFVMRIDLYRKGELHKYLENSDIRVIDGIITPFRVVMTRTDGKGKTELKIVSVKYNAPIKESLLTKEALR